MPYYAPTREGVTTAAFAHELQRGSLHGLSGKAPVHPAAAVAHAAGNAMFAIRRQPGFFMGPGGGPGGGPFAFPGYLTMTGMGMRRLGSLGRWRRLHGLGQEDTTMIPAPTELTPPPPITFPAQTEIPIFWGPVTPQPTTSIPAPTTLTPPPSILIPKQTSIPFYQGPSGKPQTGAAAFFQSSTLGVPNKYLAVGVAAIVGLVALKRRRR